MTRRGPRASETGEFSNMETRHWESPFENSGFFSNEEIADAWAATHPDDRTFASLEGSVRKAAYVLKMLIDNDTPVPVTLLEGGGTIATEVEEGSGLRVIVSRGTTVWGTRYEQLLHDLANAKDPFLPLLRGVSYGERRDERRVNEVFNGDSCDLTAEIVRKKYLPEVVNAMKDKRTKCVEITMGTDQLVNTAQMIKDALVAEKLLNKPIFITGSNLPWKVTDTDAKKNVALMSIMCKMMSVGIEPRMKPDVYIVFGGKVVPATDAVEAVSTTHQSGLEIKHKHEGREDALLGIATSIDMSAGQVQGYAMAAFTLEKHRFGQDPFHHPAVHKINLHPLSVPDNAIERQIAITTNELKKVIPVPSVFIIIGHHCASLRACFNDSIRQLHDEGHIVIVVPCTMEAKQYMTEYPSTLATLESGAFPALGMYDKVIAAKTAVGYELLKEIDEAGIALNNAEKRRFLVDVIYSPLGDELAVMPDRLAVVYSAHYGEALTVDRLGNWAKTGRGKAVMSAITSRPDRRRGRHRK